MSHSISRIAAAASQANHFHALVTAEVEGADVRKWLKRWLGEALSEGWPRAEGQSWWASGGSVKWVWTRGYFGNVLGYVEEQRG